MTIKEKVALLEEMLELDEGTLHVDTDLDDIEEWDSMTKLSLIILMDEKFNKKLSGQQIKNFTKVQDIIDFMD